MTIRSQIADHTTSVVASALQLIGPTFATHVATGLSERFHPNNAHSRIKLHDPSLVTPDSRDDDIAARIHESFQRAKQRQSEADPVYRPSSLWQHQLDEAFSALHSDDLHTFHSFLANFGSSEQYTGIEHSTLIRDCTTAPKSMQRLRYAVSRMLSDWTEHESQGRDLSHLLTAMHGNLSGVTIDGRTTSLNSFGYDVSARLVTSCLSPTGNVIAELGGGYCGWLPFIEKNTGIRAFIDFDLPETLCCAAFYLMKEYPEKKILLFGERDFDERCLEDYDIILLPSCEISRLPNRSVDLFLNSASLSEMMPDTATHYLAEIFRTSRAFWHLNHESKRNDYKDGTCSLLNSEYPIPPEFRLMSKHYFTWSILYYLYPKGWDYFWRLYYRI